MHRIPHLICSAHKLPQTTNRLTLFKTLAEDILCCGQLYLPALAPPPRAIQSPPQPLHWILLRFSAKECFKKVFIFLDKWRRRKRNRLMYQESRSILWMLTEMEVVKTKEAVAPPLCGASRCTTLGPSEIVRVILWSMICSQRSCRQPEFNPIVGGSVRAVAILITFSWFGLKMDNLTVFWCVCFRFLSNLVGNTRVVNQKELEFFREELQNRLSSNYNVILKERKLPLSLLNDHRKVKFRNLFILFNAWVMSAGAPFLIFVCWYLSYLNFV